MTVHEPSVGNPLDAPLVSVVLTSYNYAVYLPQAVDSVLSQTYSNFELIAIDDGSTDESRDILSSYRDPRMRCEFQENSGQAAAWNRAFTLSRGELVLFLDSDDWWEPHKIELMVQFHRLLKGAYSILQHNLTVMRDGHEYPYRRTLQSGDCFAEMKATGNINFFVTSSGLGFPRRVLEALFPLPLALKISPDAFLTRTAFLSGPVFSIPLALGHLRLHGRNAGMTKGQAFHDRLRRDVIFPELNAFYRRNDIPFQFASPAHSAIRDVVQRLRRKGASLFH
jgi:glycosyltransferase involved in cell wall biosynthesis